MPSLAELRGRVVLVDFWTLTCINWLRQEPYVRAWSQAYRNEGLARVEVARAVEQQRRELEAAQRT